MKKKIDYYHCIGKKIYENDLYSMVPIRIEDIEKIRLWRNKQTDVLRQKKFISRTDQINYYKKNIFPDFKNKKPKNILFSILEFNKIVAYGGLVHIDWQHKRGEISFLVDTKYASTKKDFEHLLPFFLVAIKNVSFNILKLNKITAELYDIRPKYKKQLLNHDFKIEGVLKNHVKIQKRYKDSLIFGYLKRKR